MKSIVKQLTFVEMQLYLSEFYLLLAHGAQAPTLPSKNIPEKKAENKKIGSKASVGKHRYLVNR